MSGLDLKRLGSITLPEVPRLQQFVANFILWPNYRYLPGVDIAFENIPKLDDTPYIIAMNHTDRYNYFPLLAKWYRERGRYTTPWVKGKYYENPILSEWLSSLSTLPTVSRGYIFAKDFKSTLGREPSKDEYRALRDWVEALAGAEASDSKAIKLPGELVPEKILTQKRNILGRDFDPAVENYAHAVNALFQLMMAEFVTLNEKAFSLGRDLLIFPQGTRSKTLLGGKPGIGQVMLYFKKYPILPIGCNGSDKVYTGSIPFAKKGKVVYRFGEPITFEELSDFHIPEEFAPFTPEAEEKWNKNFQGVADLVTDRINDLLDPEYQRDVESGESTGAGRFL